MINLFNKTMCNQGPSEFSERNESPSNINRPNMENGPKSSKIDVLAFRSMCFQEVQWTQFRSQQVKITESNGQCKTFWKGSGYFLVFGPSGPGYTKFWKPYVTRAFLLLLLLLLLLLVRWVSSYTPAGPSYTFELRRALVTSLHVLRQGINWGQF